MTSDPATLLREGMEAWNRGDLETLLGLLDPDIRIHLTGAFAITQEARTTGGLTA